MTASHAATAQALQWEDRLRALARQAAGATHEINNIVTALSLDIEVALAEGHGAAHAQLEAMQRAVDDIAGAVARLQDLPGKAAAAPPPPARPLPSHAMNILIVDDDSSILDSMNAVLTLDGHTVTLAANGDDALAAFAKSLAIRKPIDVVITDLSIPGRDGRAISRAVKAMHPATQVILFTGWGSGADGGQTDAEIDYVLAKPPQLAQLHAALAYCASRIKWDELDARGGHSDRAIA